MDKMKCFCNLTSLKIFIILVFSVFAINAISETFQLGKIITGLR